MKIVVEAQNTNTYEVFNISSLVNSITIENFLNGQPGKMTCMIQKDPNNILNLENGSIITVVVDNVPMFYGYIFTMGTDATETYKILAYDQSRYLINPEILETRNQTASQIFTMICQRADRKHLVRHSSSFICPKYQHINKTGYSIIEYGIHQTQINTYPTEMYRIRDEFGTIVFFEVKKQLSNLVIGEKSLLMNYQYEKSIDKNTANHVVVYRVNEETNNLETWGEPNNLGAEPHAGYLRRWGLLRHMQEAGKEMNMAQMKQMAERLLFLKRRETKTMKLNALGVPQLRAGDGFNLRVKALGIDENVWIESISHTITKDTHFMQLEVFII